MTKREQFTENLKKNIVETEWTDSDLSLLAGVTPICDQCPTYDGACYGRNCDDVIFDWLQEHGDEEAEDD